MRILSSCLSLGLALSPLLPSRLAAQEVAKSSNYVALCDQDMEATFLLWTDAFKRMDDSVRIEMRPVVSAEAARGMIDGRSHITALSRELKPEETSQFTAKWGYPPLRIAVAMDALVILVHKSNPIKEIKIEQLDAVWSSARLQGWPGDIPNWGELGLKGRNWAERPIYRVGLPEGSGLRDFFLEAVDLGGKSKPDTKSGADAMWMVNEIGTNEGAMGYGSIGEVYLSVRAVPIVPKGGKKAVEPKPASVADGSYPLSRMIYIFVNKAPDKALDTNVANFVRFVLSKEGQKLVGENGLIPLSNDFIAVGLRRLN